MDASVPKIVETIPAEKAIITLFKSDAHSLSESNSSFLYQTSEKFVNSDPFVPLKENIMIKIKELRVLMDVLLAVFD